MKKSISEVRVTAACFPIYLVAGMFLWGCASTDPQSVTKFKQGLSTVKTGSQTIFLEFTRFDRDLKLDRAAKLANLKESDVAPALDAKSISQWHAALDALSLYASSLETLAAPTGGTKVEESLTSLGDRIIALGRSKDPTESASDELNKAVGHIGRLIVDAKAKKRALEIAREADPSVRAVALHMADMLGSDHSTGGLRTTMWSNWTTIMSEYQISFLASGADKRKVAATYSEAIEGRQASDLALDSLRGALLDLADLHSAVAQGRSEDASDTIGLLRQEVAYAKQLLESAKISNPNGGTP